MEYPLLPKQMPKRIKAVWRKNCYVFTTICALIGVGLGILLQWQDLFEGVWLGILMVILLSLFLYSFL